MLSALGRDEDAEKLRQLRRLIELEHELGTRDSISNLAWLACAFDNIASETQMHFREKCRDAARTGFG